MLKQFLREEVSKSVYRTYTIKYASNLRKIDYKFEDMDSQRQKKLAKQEVKKRDDSKKPQKTKDEIRKQLYQKKVDLLKRKKQLLKQESVEQPKSRINRVSKKRRLPRLPKRSK